MTYFLIDFYFRFFLEKLRIIGSAYLDGSDLVATYRQLGLSYPKFFKMDKLSKLGYLAAAKIFGCSSVDSRENSEQYAMIFCCNSSSIDCDIEFQQTIQNVDNYFPSPSIFVYTLANIVMGEIAIAFKLRGENTMFVARNENVADLQTKVEQIFRYTPTKSLLCASIDYSTNRKEVLMLMIEANENEENQEFNNDNIIKLLENGRANS